jgi:hypothetical protein
MKIGNTNVAAFRLGEVTPSKVYLGTTEVWTAGSPPDAPSVDSASYSAIEGKLYLSVNAPNDNGAAITEYYIYFDNTFAYSAANPNNPITDATNRVGANVTVTAVNSLGESAQSTSMEVIDADYVPPASPTAVRNVVAVTSTTQPSAADISWDAPESDGGSEIVGYNVYYSEDGGLTWLLYYDEVQSPLTISVPDRGGNSISVRVTAVNAVGEGVVDLSEEPYVTLSNSPLSLWKSETFSPSYHWSM